MAEEGDREEELNRERFDDVLTQSAVVVPRFQLEDGREAILLTRRADHLSRHAGEVSFPGGSKEATDDSLRETALRELHEEVGVPPVDADVRRQLKDVLTTTGFVIRPFLAEIPYPYEFTVQEEEVDTVLTASLDELVEPGVHEMESQGGMKIHYFHLDDHTVWGATGEIVARLLQEERGWKPDV